MPVAKESGKEFTPIPAGSHIGRCFGVISLGTQASPMYPSSFKVMLMFEVPAETFEIDGVQTPMTIQKEYTLSLSEKANLRHDLQSWRGREFTAKELEGFAVEKVIGQPCMLSIVHKVSAKKKTYAHIASISGIPKGMQCPVQFHKTLKFEVDDGMHESFKALPEWIQKKIQICEEWVHPAAAEPPPPEPDIDHDPDSQDVPFN